jgi:hydrogenase maturation protease
LSRVLIIGYGNPLRGDDGIGPRAAEALADRWAESEVRVETSHQLLVEMAPLAAESDFVVFIDAGRDGEPGDVRAVPVGSVELGRSSLTHHVTPGTLLAVSRSLYGRRPDAVLATVGGEDFGPGEKLSAKVESALPRLLARVAALVDSRLKENVHA